MLRLLILSISFCAVWGVASAAEPVDSVAVADAEYADLEELVVVEHQKLVKSDGATLTYSVADDPEAGSSNILDILRKVPGVTVDAQDNVRVNGQSSFKILMNGKEDPMLKGDLKTILKSIPASTIKKIEVISEPGAKYDAEGVGGILNIVTDRSRTLSGFLTQLGAWVNGYQAGGYVNPRVKLEKVMLDATVSYNNGNVWPRSNTYYETTENLDPMAETRLTVADTKFKNGWDYTGVNLNMSWEPDTLNLFTASVNYNYNTWTSYGTELRDAYRQDLSPLWSIRRDYDSSGSYQGVGTQLSFQHNFGRDDHNIVASYGLDYTHSKNSTKYDVDGISGQGSESPYSANNNRSDQYYHMAQLDYNNRFNSHHLLEAGAKMSLNDNGSHTIPSFGNSADDAAPVDALIVKMNQLKNIYALYASYSGTFSRWNVKGGLRYEHTYMGSRYKIGDYPDFTTRLNDVVPNLAVSRNLTDASSLRLAYQMRISRPYISQINPYVNVLTPGEVSYGNPDLKSQKGHTFSFSYSNYEHPLSGSAKITYRYVSNGVTDVIFMKDDVRVTTYANIGISHMGMLDMDVNWNITKSFQWSVNLSESYTYAKSDSELLKASSHGWQTNLWTNLNYAFPSRWRVSAYAGYWSPWVSLQSRGTTSSYYYGLGASRSWLKNDALTLQLSAGNFLPWKRENSYTQQSETARVDVKGTSSQWNFGVSLSFKFGGLNASVKRTAAEIEKESSSQVSSKGSN